MNLAVILPCYNEEISIAKVISDFKAELPKARIYVIDNNSTDKTSQIAKSNDAEVIFEERKGKGNAVRRAFAEINADVYIMADGDGTYETKAASKMIESLIINKLDMVIGIRKTDEANAYRCGHRLGNKLFNLIVSKLFGEGFEDIFSGYRVMTKRFVKTFPALSTGFEIETELSVHSLQLRLPTKELPTYYGSRQDGSNSKLNTYSDGIKILLKIIRFARIYRPLLFYSLVSMFFIISSLILGFPILVDYIETGLVPRFPTAILSTGLMILGGISLISGLILDSVNIASNENKRLGYLSY